MTKCELCNEEIKKTFLDKLDGTIVKTREGETSKKHYICSNCQKEHKDNLKENSKPVAGIKPTTSTLRVLRSIN